MANSNLVSSIPLASVDSSTFDGTYKVINSSGLPNACFMIRIINNSNKDITISYDGTNNHDFVPTLTSLNLEFQANASPANYLAVLGQGVKVWAKAASGTGLVYLSGYYQPY